MISLEFAKENRNISSICININIQDAYNDYLNSLKIFWRSFGIIPYFKNVLNLKYNSWINLDDPFVKDGCVQLAKSIQTIGTFFPIVTAGNVVLEGNHRIYALNTEKIDRSILSYDYFQGYRTGVSREPVSVYIIWPSKDIKELVSMRSKFMKIERVYENYYKVTSEFFSDIYHLLLINSMFISECMYGKEIIPAKHINNEDEFKRWMSE